MYKLVAILYIVCFGCYLLFTRQPDYFDGEKAPAVIHWVHDSASGRSIPKAVYTAGLKNYAVDARYVLREWKENDKTQVIYETNSPGRGAVYLWWGYWITWGEVLGSVLLIIALFQIAVSVTKNPTAEALIEQLDYKEEKKTKYKRIDE